MLTTKERLPLIKLTEAWNGFCKLPQYHETDKKDFADAIHKAQNIIMSREAVRNNPTLFPTPVEL